jgi:hypothetical protein
MVGLQGGEVQTLHHLDRRMYLLGYMARENRLYLIDKEFQVVSGLYAIRPFNLMPVSAMEII